MGPMTMRDASPDGAGRPTRPKSRGGPRVANWTLRLGLGGALVVLIVVASVVSSMPAPSVATSTSTTSTSTTTPNGATGSQTTIPSVPGAFTDRVTVPALGNGCGFALEESTPSTSSTSASSSASTEARPVGHCTVLEIGDSLGSDLGWGISRHLAATSGLNLVQMDKSSTGLANSWFYNWPVELSASLGQYHPQLLLVFLGGNDEQGMMIDGSAVPFGEPTWEKAYLGYVREIVTEATNSGAYVMWIGLPIMQQSSYSQGMTILNSLFEEGVTSEANATFVPTWALFSNPEGQFESQAAVNGVETTLRESDGIHLSFSGEDVLATYVIREMAAVYHVALTATSPSVITHWG
jgi:lysophospholipase L1-like esterase